MKPNIELHIEELILRGFRNEDRYRITAAVEAELSRLLAEQGITTPLEASLERSRIDGGTFKVAHDTPVEAVGTHIARNVYGGLGE